MTNNSDNRQLIAEIRILLTFTSCLLPTRLEQRTENKGKNFELSIMNYVLWG